MGLRVFSLHHQHVPTTTTVRGRERKKEREKMKMKFSKAIHKLYIRIRLPHYYIPNDTPRGDAQTLFGMKERRKIDRNSLRK
jgi:hypothetical protein